MEELNREQFLALQLNLENRSLRLNAEEAAHSRGGPKEKQEVHPVEKKEKKPKVIVLSQRVSSLKQQSTDSLLTGLEDLIFNTCATSLES
jgi:hypothetical protein